MMTSNTLTFSNRSSTQQSSSSAALDRKKILITGCSSGIGYHLAHALQQAGHIVIASARKQADVERLLAEGLHAVLLDLTDSHSIQSAINATLSLTAGELDVLINNGAYGQPGAVEDLSRQTLEAQFACNVFGTHELTQRLIKTLLKSEAPRVIQISSLLGFVAMPFRGAYVASKFALEGLSDTLRLEMADTKLKVVLIEPGPIRSRFRDNAKVAFLTAIDPNKSRHKTAYQHALSRLESDKNQPFTLPPEAVYQAVLKALGDNPRPRYYVTVPSYVLMLLKRLLPSRWLDKCLLKIATDEAARFEKKEEKE